MAAQVELGITASSRQHANDVSPTEPIEIDNEQPPRGSTGLEIGISSNDGPPEVGRLPVYIPKSLTFRLYVSHFLSTWNSRLFEFGAVLFLASIYPGTLLAVSVYALVRSGSAIVFSPAVGSWIDRGDRLNVVRASIIGQRLSVAASCGIFCVLQWKSHMRGMLRTALFALVISLACVEKLCAVMNTVSVERDWVVVITGDDEVTRRNLNARMRRIDLFCKLVGPLVISLINGASTIVAIWTTLGMSALSVAVEYICIARVFKMVPALQRVSLNSRPESTDLAANMSPRPTAPHRRAPTWARSTLVHLIPWQSLSFYFHHSVFLPSFALSLLYFTVLSFSGQMITFLLASGYKSTHVGIARTVSTIFELSATWIAPRLAQKIGSTRGGMWFLCWQLAWLAGAVSWFFADGDSQGTKKVLAASGLVGGVSLSRIGLWGFDLCAQNIVQDAVEEVHRGAFSSVEASFQNLFELLSYASTIIFSRPDQFQWPVVLSVGAVYLAGGLHAAYVRRSRGHLFHAPSCLHPKADS